MSVEAAYLAGLFDGEGNVVVLFSDRHSHGLHVKVEIVNTFKQVLLDVQSEWGGKFYEVSRCEGTRLRAYKLTFHGEQADALVAAILPHSRIKRHQLEIFREARRLVRPRQQQKRLTEDECIARLDVVTRLRESRLVGVEPTT
jgi:hypothetical protein